MRKKRYRVLSLLVTELSLLLVGACSSGDDHRISGDRNEPLRVAEDVQWPVTLRGTLEVMVEEGTAYEDDLSEINFCSLRVDEGYYLLEVGVEAVREAGWTREEFVSETKVEVLLDGPSDLLFSLEIPYYRVLQFNPL